MGKAVILLDRRLHAISRMRDRGLMATCRVGFGEGAPGERLVVVHLRCHDSHLPRKTPHDLHISIAFEGELSASEVRALRRTVDGERRLRFGYFGRGYYAELCERDPLHALLRGAHSKGQYKDRPLHVSF